MNVLRLRVWSALTAGWALAGCSPSAPPGGSPGVTPRPVEPTPAPLPSVTIEPSPSPAPPTPVSQPVPLPAPPVTVAIPPHCGPPETYCVAPRSVPAGHQLPPDPATLSFDANGCLPGSDHSHSCSGIHALAGPRFEQGQCCYTICRGPVPPCGRPFVIAETARVAPLVARSSWAAEHERRRAPRGLRAHLAAAWRRDARFEHASIASFSRFALELLVVGAPPSMVADAHAAAADEVEHARLCFALATSYDGDPSGAGAWPLAGFRVGTGLAEVAAAAVREGCIGETFAAHVAHRAAEACRDRSVTPILRRIADDELRHAELAWRFVAWAVAKGDDSVRAAVAEAFTHVPDVTDDAPAEADLATWASFGRFDAATLVRLRDDVLREVVAPSAALVSSPPTAC